MTWIHDIERAEWLEAGDHFSDWDDAPTLDEVDFDPIPESDIPEDMRRLLADLFPESDPSDDLPF